MNPELDDLYREVILDHSMDPRNYGPLPDATVSAEGNNPLCGDMVTLHLRLHDGRVSAVTFEGVGCSISQASASMLTEVLTNTSAQDAAELARSFRAWMQGADPDRDFGDLEALAGVRSFPMRVKCATLAWNTLLDALSRS